MNIVKDWPPNIKAIRKVFTLPKGVIFTYGNVIYNPYGARLGKSLIAHECVHIGQQEKYGVEKWWKRYLVDAEWRLEQELEAHRIEYITFCTITYSREKRNKFLFEISSRLAGPMYGRLLTIREAMKEIKR